MLFTVDVYAWIPLPDVPNPLFLLPGGTSVLGPGACGPRFGGDNFVAAPTTPSAWSSLTYRARQRLSFDATTWGSTPITATHSGVVAGTTTVLTAPRPGGITCHSMTATVEKSSGTVSYSSSDNWYEVKMKGKVMDPYPANTGGRVGGNAGSTVGGTVGGAAGSVLGGPAGSVAGQVLGSSAGGSAGSSTGTAVATAITPSLEWDLLLRIQRGTAVGLATRMRYTADCPLPTLDTVPTGTSRTIGTGSGNLMHGTIEVRRFPSYVVYVTMDSASEILFFADASKRNLLEIAVPSDSELRRVTW